MARAKHALDKAQRDHAQQELEVLLTKLEDAHADRNLEQAQLLLAQWNEIAATVPLGVDDRLSIAAEPVLTWLAESKRQHVQVKEFDHRIAIRVSALDSGASRIELERAYYSAIALGQTMPASLEQRFRERLVHISLIDRYKTMGLLIVCCTLALVILIVVYALFLR